MNGLPEPRRTAAVAAVLAAMALVVLDAGMANLAVPTIGRALGVEPSEALVVVTAYQAAVVMALLPCGALGERLGCRRVFVAGVVVFAAAAAACAAAPSLAWLAAGRLAQGLGGAAVMALGVALLRETVPQDRLGAAIGWNALTVALASAAAPSLGALVLHHADWRWLFVGHLPVAVLAAAAAFALPRGNGGDARLDPLSMGLNVVAFGLLMVAAQAMGGPAWAVLAPVAGSAAAFVALVRREAPKAAPLVPFDLLRRPAFRGAVLASVCCFTGQSAGMIALSFHLQGAMGLDPLAAALCLTPWPLAVASASVVAGRAAERLPTAWLCAVGAGGLAAGLAACAAWPASADAPERLMACAALCGLGFGLFQTPNNRSLFLAAPRQRAGAAGGAQATARLTGQTAGALAMTTLLGVLPVDTGARAGLALAAAAALAAAVASLLRAGADQGEDHAPSVRHVTPGNAEA